MIDNFFYGSRHLNLIANFQVEYLITSCNLQSHDYNIRKYHNTLALLETIMCL